MSRIFLLRQFSQLSNLSVAIQQLVCQLFRIVLDRAQGWHNDQGRGQQRILKLLLIDYQERISNEIYIAMSDGAKMI